MSLFATQNVQPSVQKGPGDRTRSSTDTLDLGSPLANSAAVSNVRLSALTTPSLTESPTGTARREQERLGPTVTAEKAQAYDNIAEYGRNLLRSMPMTPKGMDDLRKAGATLANSTAQDLDAVADAALKLPRSNTVSKTELIDDFRKGLFAVRAFSQGGELALSLQPTTSEADKTKALEIATSKFVESLSEIPPTLRGPGRKHFVEGYRMTRWGQMASGNSAESEMELKTKLKDEVAAIEATMWKGTFTPLR